MERTEHMPSPQLTPDEAKFIFSLALPTLKTEHQTTKRVIETLDKGEYRPDAISNTALELAGHIVAAEKRFLSGIAAGAFDFTPVTRTEWITNTAGIAAWLEQSFAASQGQVDTLSGEHGNKMSDLSGMSQPPDVSFVQNEVNHT